MKNKLPSVLVSIFFILAAMLNACAPQTGPTVSPAPSTDAAPSVLSAILSEIIGKVDTRQADQDAFSPAQLNSFLNVNGQAMTGADGRVRLDLSTGTIIRVASNSLFTLAENESKDGSLQTRFDLAVGELFIILNGGTTEINTPTGTAAVRGSYMSVSYDPNSGETRITCLEGSCSLSNEFGSVEITAGQTAVITGPGQPPQIGEMSQQDIQAWLDNNPEAGLVVESLMDGTVPTEVPTEIVEQPIPIIPTPIPPLVTTVPPGVPVEPNEEEPAPTPLLTTSVSINNVYPAGAVTGEPLTIAVSVTPSPGGLFPTGTVKVYANGNPICTASLDSAGFASCVGGIPSVGTFSLVAKYYGDANFLAAQSAPLTGFTVTKATTTTTIVSPPNPSTLGIPFSFTATVDVDPPGAGTPYGSVTFSDGVGDNCIVTSAPWTCSITFSTIGTFSITATYSGDANFNGSFSSPMFHDVLP